MGGVSFLRPFLQNLCFNSPWNYAVFWKLRAPQHENVLAWEDGFCNIQKLKIPEDIKIEDFYSTEILHSDFSPYLLSKNPCNYTVGLAVAEMSRTSHVMGNGVVGEVALTRKPRWIYAAQIAADTSKTIISQYPDEWLLQIAAGIKTILLFPVVPHGVLQLGSIEMVAEDATILSCVENVLACCDDSGLPDWRYLIRELPLMFSVDDPSASVIKTESTVIDEIAANQSMTEYMLVHDFCNPTEQHSSAISLENGIVFGVSSEHTVPADGPYQLSASDYQEDVLRYFQCDDILQASLYSEDVINWNSMQGGGFVNLLEDLSFSEQSFVALQDDAIYDAGINGLFNDVAPTSSQMEQETAGVNKLEKEALFGFADAASCSMDESASSRSCVTSFKFEAKPLIGSKRRHHCPPVLKQVSKSEFVAPPACLSPSAASSVESKNVIIASSSPGDQHQRKSYHHPVNRGRVSRLSRSNKRKDCSSSSDNNNQRPRPRDRQLIQDRIKELRELVPNSEKCSIDGLLDKTIKHMLFLRNVSDRADKLRKHEADKMMVEESGASWAVELGSSSSSSDAQTCPIVVKDLDQPGQMLIEMLCCDHGRFLEITNAIHRLQLTVLHGVMEKSPPRESWARFIVETSGSFHRLDIFWPLMQLLQQNRMTKI